MKYIFRRRGTERRKIEFELDVYFPSLSQGGVPCQLYDCALDPSLQNNGGSTATATAGATAGGSATATAAMTMGRGGRRAR